MAIIGINGYSGSGKDTLGRIIQELDPNQNWEIKKFAGKLKHIATLLTGIDQKKFEDQQFKQKALGKQWYMLSEEGYKPMTARDLLQKVGTDAMRNNVHPDVWVNALMADYKPIVDISTFRYAKGYIDDRKVKEDEKVFPVGQMFEYLEEVPHPNWVITDVRFENEAKAIKNKKGIIIRIDRPGVIPVNDHASEIELDHWNFDYKIANTSDLSDLKENIEQILKHKQLL